MKTSPNILTLGMSLLAGVILCSMARPAHAGIAVAPLKQEISVKPGQTEHFRITITNNVRQQNARAETVRLEICDVRVMEDGQLTFMPVGSQPQSASSWITLSAQEVVIEPGQSKIIEGTVTAPHQARGEFYSAVLVTLGTTGRTDKGVSITYRIASGLFVNVIGQTFPRRARIENASVIWPAPATRGEESADSPQLPRVEVVLRNTGQVRFDASGRVRVMDELSQSLFVAPLKSARPCVFGGDSRLFVALLDRPLPAGGYVLHVEMDYQSPWGKARHQQSLQITPEQSDLLARNATQNIRSGGLVALSPERLTCQAAPGSFRVIRLTVRNTSPNPAPIAVEITRQPAEDGDIDNETSVETWCSVEPETFELPAGAQRSVALLLKVPNQAQPRTYGLTVGIKAAHPDASIDERIVPVELEVLPRLSADMTRGISPARRTRP